MISKEREAEIARLYHVEKWRIGTIAAELGHHHATVQRVLAAAGVDKSLLYLRPTRIDPFVPFIVETLEKHPRLRATRLYAMVKERGYVGAAAHFRSLVRRYRPRKQPEAYLRLRTLQGEQAQVDWGHFGKVQIGKASRTLSAFVMVLSWSRQIFLRFYWDQRMPTFLRGHVDAFEFFRGVPRTLLYDNLKSAVLERVGDAIHFHPTLLELSRHYRYLPKPVAPARGNEKGRVERAIRYVRDNFFAAREWTDIDDLNRQAFDWMEGAAAERLCPEDRSTTVRDAFLAEREKLLPLPDNPFPAEERLEVEVGKTPYVRFDLNDYSVPHHHVQRTLTVLASRDVVRITDGATVLAIHTRSWDRGQQLEIPDHIEGLVLAKQKSKTHRSLDYLQAALPQTKRLLLAVAERGGNIGNTTWVLLQMLERTSLPHELDEAIGEAVDARTPYVGAIRTLLERKRAARNAPPPVAIPLPRDTRHQHVVRPHPLSTYDQLQKVTPHDAE
jgi:transposase